MIVNIEYDGSYAYVLDCPEEIKIELKNVCSYEDKSKSYMNYKRGLGGGQVYETLYETSNHRFPTGLLPKVYATLTKKGYKVEINSKLEKVEVEELDLPDWLWPHQTKAIAEALKYMRCTIQSPTGSGKTTIIAYLIQHFPDVNILITVPTLSLLYSMKETIENNLITTDEEIGIVGDGKKKWRRITVSTVQSAIIQLEKNKELAESIEVAVHDECHHCGSNSYDRLRKTLVNASFSIGFSGTVMRKDGKLIVVEGLTGPNVLTIHDSELVKKDIVLRPALLAVKCKHSKRKYKGGRVVNGEYVYFSNPNGKPELDDVYEACIVENPQRNQMIIKILQAYLSTEREGGILIVVKALRHGEILSGMASELGIDLPFVSGQTPTKERLALLDELRSHKRCLCASSIFNEGEDVKPLEVVLNAAGGSNKKNVIQISGRVTRKSEGKRPVYIDFEDEEPYYLSRQSYKRMEYLEDRHCCEFRKIDVTEIDRVFFSLFLNT